MRDKKLGAAWRKADIAAQREKAEAKAKLAADWKRARGEYATKLRREGLSNAEIASRLGISENRIANIIDDYAGQLQIDDFFRKHPEYARRTPG